MFPSKGCKGIKEALDRTRGVQMSLLSSLVQLKGLCPIVLGYGGKHISSPASASLLSIPPVPRGRALGQLPAPFLENAPKNCCGSGPENPQIQVPKSTPCRALHCKPDYLKCREIYFQLHSGISLCLEAWREEAETFPQSFALICGHNNLILQLQDPNPISFPLGYEFLPTLGAPEAPWCCH